MNEPINQLHYEEAWTRLKSARRAHDLDEVIIAAEALAHAAKTLKLESQIHNGVICDHFVVVQGICKRCGFQVVVTRESIDGSDF